MDNTDQQKQSKLKSWLSKFPPALVLTFLVLVLTAPTLATLFSMSSIFSESSSASSSRGIGGLDFCIFAVFSIFFILKSLVQTLLSGVGLRLGVKTLRKRDRSEEEEEDAPGPLETTYIGVCTLLCAIYFLINSIDLVILTPMRFIGVLLDMF